MSFLRGVISLAVAIPLVTGVLMSTIKGTNTSAWSTSEVTMWGTLGVVVVAGVIYLVATVFGIF